MVIQSQMDFFIYGNPKLIVKTKHYGINYFDRKVVYLTDLFLKYSTYDLLFVKKESLEI